MRFVLFAGLPAVSALTPFVALPAITSALGSEGFSAFAVGQGVGAFGALAVNFGWNALGPASAAQAAPEGRKDLYRASLRQRLLVTAAITPIVALLAAVISPASGVAAACMAVATALTGLLPTWYFIGVGSPINLALHDTLPRLLAATTASFALRIVASDFVYPLVLGLFVVGSSALAANRLGSRGRTSVSRSSLRISDHVTITASGLLSSGYTSLAVIFVALSNSGAVPVFAASTRFRDFGIAAVSAVANATQGWVSERSLALETRSRRRRQAFAMNITAGALGALALTFGLKPVGSIVFSGVVAIPQLDAFLTGCVLVLIAASQSLTMHFLIPDGRNRVVAVSGIATSVIGVPIILALAAWGGSAGALLALVAAEAVSFLIQFIALARSGRTRETPSATGPLAADDAKARSRKQRDVATPEPSPASAGARPVRPDS